MKPSILRTSAMATLSFVAGISATGRSMALALRMRVSMSAIGSVIMVVGIPLPARLTHPGNQAVGGHVPQTDSADAELAVHGPSPTAQLTAPTDLDDVARPQDRLLRVGVLLVFLQR